MFHYAGVAENFKGGGGGQRMAGWFEGAKELTV